MKVLSSAILAVRQSMDVWVKDSSWWILFFKQIHLKIIVQSYWPCCDDSEGMAHFATNAHSWAAPGKRGDVNAIREAAPLLTRMTSESMEALLGKSSRELREGRGTDVCNDVKEMCRRLFTSLCNRIGAFSDAGKQSTCWCDAISRFCLWCL